jgi:hypothetical protein
LERVTILGGQSIESFAAIRWQVMTQARQFHPMVAEVRVQYTACH